MCFIHITWLWKSLSRSFQYTTYSIKVIVENYWLLWMCASEQATISPLANALDNIIWYRIQNEYYFKLNGTSLKIMSQIIFFVII